jgi:hypothetical protein
LNDPGSTFVVVGVIFFVSLIIFLICREIVCWYFKLNEMVRLLGGIKEQLAEIAKQKPEKEFGES